MTNEFEVKSFTVQVEIQSSTEYTLINHFYGDRTANRSGVKLINHINEGIAILSYIDASKDAMKAFALHPMLQNDEDLAANFDLISSNEYISSRVKLLALEYRNIANAYLSQRSIDSLNDISLSPLKEVNDMLIADKVQNYKDFLIYHSKTHSRRFELDEYFNNWLRRLNCTKVFESFRPLGYHVQ